MHELDVAIGPARVKGDLVERFVAPVDALAIALVRWTSQHPARVCLLLRELLDNPARVARAGEAAARAVPRAGVGDGDLGVRAGVLEVRTPETAVLHVVGGLHYVVAARPTVGRIVGAARANKIAAGYEREAIAFARHTLGVPAAYARMQEGRGHAA